MEISMLAGVGIIVVCFATNFALAVAKTGWHGALVILACELFSITLLGLSIWLIAGGAA
jgi:hypothetical protein